ncbi:MAG: replicative DNA helicase [Treponema sp.]|jgi:replicative DNA helicase|nr:replicative DNA helicase [Treponema sp.]
MDIELKDKVPPHNLDAEQATLGAILLDWEAMSDVVTKLRSDRFYNLQNQIVFDALISLFKQNVRGDTLTVINELTKLNKLEQAGGAAYVATLTELVPSSANIDYYVDIILDCASRRDLIKLASELRASAFDDTKEAKVLLETAEKKVFDLADHSATAQIWTMQTVVNETVRLIEQRFRNNSQLTGIPSGIAKLDTMTSGFQKSELIIIGARPSIGKTAFALSMMQEIAVERKIPCGFFSLEMSRQSIGQRLLSQVSRIQSGKIRKGMLAMPDLQKIQDAAGKCYNAPLYISDVPNMPLLDLRASARRMVSNQDVKIIFIDYIGLISVENPSQNTWENISEISRSLKALARELDIPIVALSQVARDAEGQEPNLAQLRGSGSIEQDADVVLFLHRDRKIMDEENLVQPAKCIVAKQRNGATGDIEMVFFPQYTKFENKVDE